MTDVERGPDPNGPEFGHTQHCFSTHYENCPPPDEEEDIDLFAALRTGDAEVIGAAVQAAYKAESKSVKLVGERRAWQVEACSGLVIAHVPIPTTLKQPPG